MHIIHDDIGLPKLNMVSTGDNAVTVTIAPLPNGFGTTLGNSLRRVILSSTPGAAITAIRINGATHEYTTIEGMQDSVLDLALNLKQVALHKSSVDSEIITLNKKGKGPITAGDLTVSSDIEILNPDLVLTHLNTDKDELKLEAKVEKGVGYLPARVQQEKNNDGENWIYLDASFSPIDSLRYEVTATRVGENTNLDKLEIHLTTTGATAPESAIKYAAKLLENYFNFFQTDADSVPESEFMASLQSPGAAAAVEDETEKQSYTPIEVLNLSPRTLNALINGNIGSIEELIATTPATLENLRGFGKKAMDEVSAALSERNLTLSELS